MPRALPQCAPPGPIPRPPAGHEANVVIDDGERVVRVLLPTGVFRAASELSNRGAAPADRDRLAESAAVPPALLQYVFSLMDRDDIVVICHGATSGMRPESLSLDFWLESAHDLVHQTFKYFELQADPETGLSLGEGEASGGHHCAVLAQQAETGAVAFGRLVTPAAVRRHVRIPPHTTPLHLPMPMPAPACLTTVPAGYTRETMFRPMTFGEFQR